MKAIGLDTSHADVVGGVLDLESDPRVDRIEVSYGTVGYRGLSVNVDLKKGFSSLDAFRDYLKENNLPHDDARFDDRAYWRTFSRGVRIQFNVPYRIRRKK